MYLQNVPTNHISNIYVKTEFDNNIRYARKQSQTKPTKLNQTSVLYSIPCKILVPDGNTWYLSIFVTAKKPNFSERFRPITERIGIFQNEI